MLEPRLALDPARQAFFQSALDVDDTIGRLLAEQFATVTAIANVSIDTLTEVVVGDRGIAEEIRLRSREYLTRPRRTLSFFD